MKGMKIVAIATLLATLYLAAAEKNPPECPEETGEIILYPKPENCSEFYQCAYGVLYTHVCGPGLYYCAEKEYCDYPDNCDYSGCKMDSKGIDLEELFRDINNTVCPPEPNPNITVIVPNPENCSNFYECVGGVGIGLNCPAGLYFCSELDICSYPDDVNCSYSDCKKTLNVKEINFDYSSSKDRKGIDLDELFRDINNTVCPPEPNPNITVIVPNPENCSNFYECVGGVGIGLNCPAGLYFCSELDICSYPDDVNCSYSDCKKTLNVREIANYAAPECPSEANPNITVIYPNPDNCSNFYECDNGHPVLIDCPKGLQYCSELGLCSYVNDGNCSYSDCKKTLNVLEIDTYAAPECPSEANPNVTVIYPNPDNCSNFYECDNGHPVLIDCPKGLQYCSELGLCSYVNDGNCSYSDCKKTLNVREIDTYAAPECPSEANPNITILYSNPDNCSNFYECDNGHPVLIDCPKGLQYCSELNLCAYVDDEKCSYSDCKKTLNLR